LDLPAGFLGALAGVALVVVCRGLAMLGTPVPADRQPCRTAIAVGDHGQPTTRPGWPRCRSLSFLLHLRRSGGRVEPGPGGGGEQLHLGVGKDPVIAERAAEQAGRHDGHALGMQATAMDVDAVAAPQGVSRSSRRAVRRSPWAPRRQVRACLEGRNRSRQPTSAAATRPTSPAHGSLACAALAARASMGSCACLGYGGCFGAAVVSAHCRGWSAVVLARADDLRCGYPPARGSLWSSGSAVVGGMFWLRWNRLVGS
jgi:hypothetical protein